MSETCLGDLYMMMASKPCGRKGRQPIYKYSSRLAEKVKAGAAEGTVETNTPREFEQFWGFRMKPGEVVRLKNFITHHGVYENPRCVSLDQRTGRITIRNHSAEFFSEWSFSVERLSTVKGGLKF